MDRAQLPLNALRAFEAAARHLNFTRAALELRVSQTALSHQIRQLEERLGMRLFRRLPRGVALTDEGLALVPALNEAFDAMAATIERCRGGRLHEVLTVGVVTTFATGWLLPRLDGFRRAHPGIDLRLLTNNNRVDQAGDRLDLAIRFGDGAWHGIEATPILDAPLSLLCAPRMAAGLRDLGDLDPARMLRSYRAEEWPRYFAAAGLDPPRLHGPVFDSSLGLAHAAMAGHGYALLPAILFQPELESERLVSPFAQTLDAGRYWLTRLQSRAETAPMAALRHWLLEAGAIRRDRAPATPPAT